MTVLDSLLQKWRYSKAVSNIPQNARVLDIGSEDGSFLKSIQSRIKSGTGIDLVWDNPWKQNNLEFIPGSFPGDAAKLKPPYDVITMIAVLEHLQESQLSECARQCYTLLKPGGLVVITIPSPVVDQILMILKKLKLVQARSLDEHHGLCPEEALMPFSGAGFLVLKHEKFQLGLNNLIVLQKTVVMATS